MNHWIFMLLEASVAITLFYGYYHYFLRKETFFMANRFYLLSTAGFSILIPWFNFTIHGDFIQPAFIFYNVLETVSVTASGYETRIVETLSGWQWILMVYLIGVIGSFILLIFKVGRIYFIGKNARSKVQYADGKEIITVDKAIVPFSFLNRIYIPATYYQNEQIQKIVAHEKVHIHQGHTLDCLFYECLIVLFWFHPIVYRYRTSAKEIHEYLADQGAIRSGIQKTAYQELLFAQATGLQVLTLPNSFNYSLIKRRLLMLSKIKSSPFATTKFVWLLPLFVVVLFVFACNKSGNIENQQNGSQVVVIDNQDSVHIIDVDKEQVDGNNSQTTESEKVYITVDQMPEFPGGESKLREFIAQQVKYPKEAKEKGIQGKVFVSFCVDVNGKICDVALVKGAYPSLDEEALRVVKAQPDWKPGKDKGVPVKVSFTIPISFQLK
ncbi:MAG TPA: hypothetical protein DCQ26_03575 [Marinilabiliales bacterium]|nr:MAG: hypothetical protein A2W95_12680 [Bacteroidetes bacterium GWA2_40_14]OFX57716.1 MAG: hypothetical protein A2W84_06085 [Bacteroidetes bacterium GWC2_40_13]OFX71347.1 MAG: hypothetical protein A2W96_14385 [Bacteroidetes bacterium GWD2_40_43]OFX91458.1 MAG: hypothetical protein A2W97_04470 [Bacteroidetes bacterium GWE2_40_63]OFY19528.1 MAG: hypothetical protein A2W88_02350 [Bacteroidetes bacterium GWF2_40_13]OFZ32207.1 MAG: hypothetical protein A2437_19530 [Bacteroidetes bacterium RIFOXYC